MDPIENLWWDVKKAVAALNPKNISDLEAIAHEKQAKMLMSGYASQLQLVITAKECSTEY